MLVDVKKERKQWVSTFNKKFSNFANNAPIVIGFDVHETSVDLILHLPSKTEIVNRRLEFDSPVEDFIAELRSLLVEWYPSFRVTHTYQTDLDQESINSLVLNGMSFAEAVEQKREVTETEIFTVDKVFNDQNTLQLIDENGNSGRYFCRIPVSFFMNKISYNATVSRDFFDEKLMLVSKK